MWRLASWKKSQRGLSWWSCWVKALAALQRQETGKSIACPGSLDSYCRPLLSGPPWLCALSHLSVFQISGVKCLPSPQHNCVFRFSAQLYFFWIWLRHISLLENQYSSFFLSDSRNLYLSRSSIHLFNNFEKWTEIIYNLGFFLLDLTLTFCK